MTHPEASAFPSMALRAVCDCRASACVTTRVFGFFALMALAWAPNAPSR